METILVSGGAGYIGSHVCKMIAREGYIPIVFDNLINGHRWAVKWGPLEEGDITDRKRLNAVVKEYNPKTIMHFAAEAYVGESIKNPGKYYLNNVAGTLSLLETMRDHSVKNIIFSSSCATYGIPEQIPIPEEHPQHPINPYGFSKFMCEQMIKDFSVAHGVQFVILRYFNAAGADPEAEIGEFHDPETHLIPLLLDVAMGKQKYINIFGTDYETHDGTCIRDYIHVSDIANAHLLALEYLGNGGKNDIFNLGNGNGFSVREVIETVKNVTGKNIKCLEKSRRQGEPPILIGSSKKANKVLGWEPKFDKLEDIINTAFEWHK
ncbi:MAG: UDP-glucose 4-epimerase GalE, partial [Candidatus Hodarchaeota archaeon]